MKNIGHCPHGEFNILEGCPKCIAETISVSGGIPEGLVLPESELTTADAIPPSIEEQIKTVAEARCKAQTLKEMVSELRTEWEKYNSQTLDNLTQAGADVAVEEAKLRELTLQAYAETGNKAPAEGVSVKIFQTLDYDPKEALKWAMSHQIALSLDKKTFETLVKATPLEFVSITDEPRAQIATNLDEYIK